MGVYDNAKNVLERISEAAVKSGRNPDDVLLSAASKQQPFESIFEARRAGICAFGENHVQEMKVKAAQGAYNGVQLHFIGHLQKNKVKDVAGKVDLIQSADSEELIAIIGKRAAAAGIRQNILIEVNIGGEPGKSGVPPEKVDELAAFASETDGIEVSGLMAIPPANENFLRTRPYFDRMMNLFIDMGKRKYDNVNMKFLSMGMSGDFEEAILAGANMVRVGTAIFGARSYT